MDDDVQRREYSRVRRPEKNSHIIKSITGKPEHKRERMDKQNKNI